MRLMITVAVVGVLIAGPLAAQPASRYIERTMEDWFDLTYATIQIETIGQGVVPVGANVIRSVNAGETARVKFHLEAGVRYGVVSLCFCDELDFEMHDSAGPVLNLERTVSGGAGDITWWVTPADSGAVTFDARPDDCSGQYGCAVGMQLFRADR